MDSRRSHHWQHGYENRGMLLGCFATKHTRKTREDNSPYGGETNDIVRLEMLADLEDSSPKDDT